MFKILLRARLSSYWAWFTGSSRSKKRRTGGKAVLFALLMVYVLCCFGFMMYGMFSQLAAPFSAAGFSWLYFTLYGIMLLSLMVIGTVFLAKSQLYEAKDNDLLLSMPIKPKYILATRIMALVITNLVYGLVAAVPAALAWGRGAQAPVPGSLWLCFIMVSLALVLLSLSISCLLALFLSALTSRMRSKTIVDTVVSLVFLLAYFWFCARMNSMIATLAASGDFLAGKLGSVAPLYWLGASVAAGDIKLCAIILLASVVPFLLIYVLLSATFISTATAKRGGAKIKYVDRGQKVSSVFSALYHRELSRFLSSSGYIINAGLGAIFLIIAAAALIIKKNVLMATFAQMPGFAGLVVPIVLLGLCLMTGMTTISAPSVSIEGKNLWIAQSIPVPTTDILRAKLMLHISIVLPAVLFGSVAVIIALRPAGLMLALTILLPAVFAVFSGVMGLMANLRHPNFDWTSETQAVKNGMSVMIALFGSWGVVAVPIVLILALGVDASIVLSAYAVVLGAGCWLMYRWIMTKGAKIFCRL